MRLPRCQKLSEVLNFRKRKIDREEEKRPLVRHEIWRRGYREQPYLRLLSEECFVEYAAQIIATMEPHFLINGQKLPPATIARLGEAWTHVLEEAEFRCLDMKKIISRT